MSESATTRLQTLLDAANGGDEIRLPRKEAQELSQKLRARGATSAARLDSLLGRSTGPDVGIPREQARALVDELRASGRRWVFGGGDATAEPAAPETSAGEAQTDPEVAAPLPEPIEPAFSLAPTEPRIAAEQAPPPAEHAPVATVAEQPPVPSPEPVPEPPAPTPEPEPSPEAAPEPQRGFWSRLFSRP